MVWPGTSGTPGLVISLSQRGQKGAIFDIQVSFGDHAKYNVKVTNPIEETEETELAWYFEEHLRYPFLDHDREQHAGRKIAEYGERLFTQVFGGAVHQDYLELRRRSFDGCRVEISGSAALHGLHWEAMRDPDLDKPLAVLLPITRQINKPSPHYAPLDQAPTLNVLVVTARPEGMPTVGYRTISRPLLNALGQVDLPLTVDLVRPGTWEALRAHLQLASENHGFPWYHIVHLDLHGAFSEYSELNAALISGRLISCSGPLAPFHGRSGFLFFETEQQGVAGLIPAEALASLLAQYRVQVVVLNACQSAMQSASEASLAQRLAEAGVPVTVGMAYSMTVSAARQAIPVLYEQLASGSEPAVALLAARRGMYEHKDRQAYFAQDIELEDWLLPVMFDQHPVQISLREISQDERAPSARATVTAEPHTEFGFVGRDLDIQAIEHHLLTDQDHNELLIQGMAGAGKSTLLSHLSWWWQITGLVDQVFRFGNEDHMWTCAQIVRYLELGLFSPIEQAQADTMSDAARFEQVVERLRTRRSLLILDNTESLTAPSGSIGQRVTAEQQKLKVLLARLRGGRTLVLLGSRGMEDWFTDSGEGPQIYSLPGLDPQAASILVERILRRHGVAHDRYSAAERAALQDILTLLEGYPLPLTVVLPALTKDSPPTVLREFQAGYVRGDASGLIERAISFSYERFDTILQDSLLLFAPFTSVIGTEPTLQHYKERLLRHSAIRDMGRIELVSALELAKEVGLAGPHPSLINTVEIQPVLPYFLRNRLRGRQSIMAAAEQAHYQLYYDIIGPILLVNIASNDSGLERTTGLVGTDAHYANLTSAIRHGIRTAQPIRMLVAPIFEYLHRTQQHDTLGELLNDTITAYPQATTLGQKQELAELHESAGQTALVCHRLEEAKAHFETELHLLQATDDDSSQGNVYQNLGRVAFDQREFENADASYQKALAIFLRTGDQRMASSVYEDIGDVHREQWKLTEAEVSYRNGLRIALDSGEEWGAAFIYNKLGIVAQNQRRFSEAEKSYRKAIRIYREYSDLYSTAAVYFQLGNTAHMQGHLEEAEVNYRKALSIYLEYGDRYETPDVYHQLGMTTEEQGRYQEAEECYDKALDLFHEFNNWLGAAATYNQRGSVNLKLGRLQEAKRDYHEALNIKLRFEEQHGAASSYQGLAEVARQEGRPEEAEECYRKALEIYLDTSDLYGAATVSHNLGAFYHRYKQFQEAEIRYRAALELFGECKAYETYYKTATNLGIALAQMHSHSEAVRMLSIAAMSRRKHAGDWPLGSLQWLRRERLFVAAREFEGLVHANVAAELVDELAEAIDAAPDLGDLDLS